jgi:hypothetical protein
MIAIGHSCECRQFDAGPQRASFLQARDDVTRRVGRLLAYRLDDRFVKLEAIS